MAKLNLYESFTGNSWMDVKKSKSSLREDMDAATTMRKIYNKEFKSLYDFIDHHLHAKEPIIKELRKKIEDFHERLASVKDV